MLISSRNTWTDTPRHDILPILWALLLHATWPVKLTITHPISPHCSQNKYRRNSLARCATHPHSHLYPTDFFSQTLYTCSLPRLHSPEGQTLRMMFCLPKRTFSSVCAFQKSTWSFHTNKSSLCSSDPSHPNLIFSYLYFHGPAYLPLLERGLLECIPDICSCCPATDQWGFDIRDPGPNSAHTYSAQASVWSVVLRLVNISMFSNALAFLQDSLSVRKKCFFFFNRFKKDGDWCSEWSLVWGKGLSTMAWRFKVQTLPFFAICNKVKI